MSFLSLVCTREHGAHDDEALPRDDDLPRERRSRRRDAALRAAYANRDSLGDWPADCSREGATPLQPRPDHRQRPPARRVGRRGLRRHGGYANRFQGLGRGPRHDFLLAHTCVRAHYFLLARVRVINV